MGKVRILPEDIINKIAAGEVVEGPFSVLKELIENSIDANCQKIEINIEKSGKKLIYVKDDGDGIEAEDIEKIFERHATSKIKEREDLYKIKTLGFRGEALYSIGNVSDIVLKSKTYGQLTGKEIHIRGGKRLSIKDCIMVKGTIVEVRELFFNIPARKKFLKSDISEYRKLLNVLINYVIGFPYITFNFKSENRKIFNLEKTESYVKRFVETLNLDEKYIIYGEKEYEDLNIKLILGDVNLKRSQKDMQFIYINSRPVYYPYISSTINNFFQSFFSTEYFPVFSLYLSLPFENVDVNIHPTKREVKIKNEEFLVKEIITIIKNLLPSGKPIILSYKASSDICKEFTESIKEESNLFQTEEKKTELFFEERKLTEKLINSIFIGIFRNKYLIYEYDDSLYFIDQHAAVERINYEKFLEEIEKNDIKIKQFLIPIILNLSVDEMIIWEKIYKILEKYGFETTKWSENKIAIHSAPSLIKDIEFTIRNFLAEKDIEGYDKNEIAKMACKVSITTGEKLTEEEAKYIVEELIKCKNPFVCPHGRPIIVEIKEKFLDKFFLR